MGDSASRPRYLAAAAPRFEAVVQDELARPLRLDAIWELHWYFEQRRRVERGGPVEDQTESDRLNQVFRAPRFWALYRTWQQEGDAVLNGLASSVLADAMGRFRGRLTSQVMPHTIAGCRRRGTTSSICRRCSSPRGSRTTEIALIEPP